MRQASGTTTIMKVGFGMTLLFAAFLAVAITYNKAFKVKNEITNIIQKYEGPSKNAIHIINQYLANSGYGESGPCEVGTEYGVTSLTNDELEEAQNGKKYKYCISQKCINANGDSACTSKHDKTFYKIKVFFRFNLPFFGELAVYRVTGDTKAVRIYNECQILKNGKMCE